MAVNIRGGTSGTLADVNANKELLIALTEDEVNAGYVAIASCSDDGDLIAGNVRTVREIDSSDDYRLRVGMDTLMFEETFAGTTINTSIWDTPIATATVVQAGGFITLNNGGSTTATQGSILRSKRHFPLYSTFPICAEFLFNINTTSFNNALCEIGIGLIGTAPGTPAVDGILMRISSAGLSFVMTNNLSEITETFVTFQDLTDNGIALTNTNHAVIVLSEDTATLWVNDVIAAKINRQSSGSNLTAAMQGHLFARMYNTGTNTLTALKLNIAKMSVNLYDMNHAKPWGHIMSGFGQFCQQGASNMTVGKTQNVVASANTALPAQMTAPSATAVGTGGTSGLGGVQRFGNGASTVALTADTAYISHSFQVPLPSLSNPVTPAKNLYITGAKVTMMTRGAAGPANIGTFLVHLNFGSTTVTPVTAESATTPAKLARTTDLGMLSIPASAAVGTLATGDAKDDYGQAPICVNPGEYIQITIRPLVAYTISASQELVISASFTGYWE